MSSNPLVQPPNLPPISQQTDPTKHNVAAIIGGVMYDMPARNIGMTEDEARVLAEFAQYHLQGGLTFETQSDADTWEPVLELRRTRTTPSGSQRAGGLSFTASDSALNTDEYAYILARVDSPTSGAESGKLFFGNRFNGFWYDAFNLQGTGVINLTGGGIQFPSTQIGYAGANVLDDYEEGTWTPAYQGLTGAIGAVTYDSSRWGIYTKIGNTVFYQGKIITDSLAIGTAATGIKITGLPFTSNSGNYQSGYIGFLLVGGGTAPRTSLVYPGTTDIVLYQTNSGDDRANLNTPWPTSGLITGASADSNIIYFGGNYAV